MTFKKEVESEEELNQLKIKCLKCKTILLDKEGKHPLFSITAFTKRQKEKFLQALNNMMETMTIEEVDAEFNDIICNDLLDPKNDISKYTITHRTEPDHSILYNPPKEEDDGRRPSSGAEKEDEKIEPKNEDS
jgi:hypothetical protein